MPPKPTLESYGSLEAYLEALIGWLLDQRDLQWLREAGVKTD